MLMQHYGASTRLLDWTTNPYKAAYFAVDKHDDCDSLIWGFEYDRYIEMGNQQWKIFPEMLEDGFQHYLYPSFLEDYKGDWFICQFLHKYHFPRIIAQEGLFTFSPQFDTDHSKAISNLLRNQESLVILRIRHQDKPVIREFLKEKKRIWSESIYPESSDIVEPLQNICTDKFLFPLMNTK